MLNIVRSNRVEALLSGLAHRVSNAPLSSPLDAETVVVPSPAMARWVNLQLASEHGVAANFEYPLPASFVWQVSGDLLDGLPEQDPFGLDILAWIWNSSASSLLKPMWSMSSSARAIAQIPTAI